MMVLRAAADGAETSRSAVAMSTRVFRLAAHMLKKVSEDRSMNSVFARSLIDVCEGSIFRKGTDWTLWRLGPISTRH
jgi:hypothetical protein